MEIKITKRQKLLEINNDMCHNYYYLVHGRFYNDENTAYRKFKFVVWFDISMLMNTLMVMMAMKFMIFLSLII